VSNFIHQLLVEKKIGYAIFDADGILAKHSPNFRKIILRDAIPPRSPIWSVFPELIGSEDLVQKVLHGKTRRFALEKINKSARSGRLRYYDLELVRLSDANAYAPRLLCIVSDTTGATSLQQKIRQQKYEIELLQASLSSYGRFSGNQILGKSPQIQAIRDLIQKVAHLNTTILLLGASGTGKNLIARVIHLHSSLPDSPFVEINCAAIPETLLESEIFGFEKGAFTNAIFSKKGLLEEADGGTLFLDEIGELPLALQAKFLTFLETKTFRRLGSTKMQQVNIRVIAASNRDLKQAIEKKEFRQDLYYRLNVVNLQLPRLCEMGDDVLEVAHHFIRIYALDFHKPVDGLTEKAEKKLLSYVWPGNVRELRNVIERAVIFAEKKKIDAADLILTEEFPAESEPEIALGTDGISLADVEKKLLSDALKKASGNQSKAARLLGLSLDTFRYRVKKYQIF